MVLAKIDKIERDGNDWVSSLPPLSAVEATDPVTVLLIDSIPVDVWLEVLETGAYLFTKCVRGYFRSDTVGLTIESINELFGFSSDKDPSSELYMRGIEYVNISGDEKHLWADMIPEAKNGAAQLVRVSCFDRQVHSGSLHLAEMPSLLVNLLSKNLPGLINRSAEGNRRLLLTTDHGLSFGAKGLNHGGHGVYEKTVLRALWQNS